MDKKHTISTIFLLLIVGLIFAGCSSSKTTDNVKVESDESKVTNQEVQNVPAGETTSTGTTNSENVVTQTTNKELVDSSDNVEIGQLI